MNTYKVRVVEHHGAKPYNVKVHADSVHIEETAEHLVFMNNDDTCVAIFAAHTWVYHKLIVQEV